MSNYNEEQGRIIIPQKAWSGFRKTVIRAWNDHQDHLLQLSKSLRALLKAAPKHMHDTLCFEFNNEGFSILHIPLQDRSPLRTDFPHLPITRSARLDSEGFRITLDNASRSFTWYVWENNRAVEDAHNHPVAQAAFGALNKIHFTRNSGGEIHGDDEYNRDNFPHSTYVSISYGPS